MNRRPLRHAALARAISSILCATGALAQIQLVHAQETVAEPASAETAPAAESVPGGVVTDEVVVTADPLRALGPGPSESSMGFSKSLFETPRSVSFISEQQITLFGISTVEDLTRLVPGTYTTTRYGLQGGVNVRGVPSDMYFRGMKRLQMQGHVRTVLSAMDGIEVIKGPPSPIYGMGRIGGYENFTPKSSRATTGVYTRETSGFVQTTQGSYNRNEVQGGLGGPFNPGNKTGGYYIFGLWEDSDTYVKQVGAKQRFFQGTTSVDNMIGNFRLEFGGQLQTSITSGAYMNRVTQDMLDNGTYLAGQPMVNLDLNGDGFIGVVEAATASPVRGTLTSNNQPLNQRFNIPKDSAGNLINVNSLPKIPGVPATMKAYLNAHPEINCRAAEVMRAAPTGGPVPASGQLPVGMVLDPCTVMTVPVDYRGNGSFEREQNADQKLAFIDLINDENPNFTLKNQFIYDNIDSFKDSYLPYGENQYIKAVEDKFTVTRRINQEVLPDWLRVNMLASLNYRKTSGWIKSSGGDFDWRQDINYNGGYHYPNTKFWTQLTNPDYATGALDTSWRSSDFDDKGLGVMFDIDIFHTNIVVGGRYDKSDARATDMPTFNANTGVSPAPGVVCLQPGPGCPGAYVTGGPVTAENSDSGGSWSISISQQIGERWRPYITAANSSLQLTTSNDTMQLSVVRSGRLIGEAELQEIGIKANFLDDKFQWSSAGYRQTRIDITDPEDPSDGADVSSTESTGVETEVRWVPNRSIFFSAYVLNQFSHYIVPSSQSISLNARQLGFTDVVDPATGAVLYPAEAYLYGGKGSVSVPSGAAGEPYMERTGNPETQAGANFNYTFKNGMGIIFGANWFSEVWADRGKTTLIPAATVFNLGANWDMNSWRLRLNGYNVADKNYFRAGGGNAGIMSSMPGVRWEITAKKEFD
jgi:outer membrane receptor protein involved in Fe transport